MKIADLSKNEAERLLSLESYQILDTEAEASYDDIARLAAAICETPVALITLVDANRQWFKSQIGIEMREAPRDTSFCTQAILSKDIFMVEDSRLDPRFNANPMVTSQPYVVFYAGAPLITPTGEALGTLCVIDHTPRQMNSSQLSCLKALARQVTSQLELRKQNFKVIEQMKELKRTTKVISDQQEMMIRQAKMSAVGIMACGVAHEINNPLTVIKTKSYILKEKYANTPEADYVGKACDVISQTSDRIHKIVKSLQTLSQNEEATPVRKVPLVLLVEEALSLSKIRSTSQDVGLRSNLESFRNIYIEVNPVQFGQALLNLLNNAFDAVAGLNEKWIELKVDASTDKVKVVVIDSGSGLPKEAANNLFQPFFTTKEVGQGTGLGLSLSRSLIEKQNGVLEYLSTEKNTTFLITLPKIAS